MRGSQVYSSPKLTLRSGNWTRFPTIGYTDGPGGQLEKLRAARDYILSAESQIAELSTGLHQAIEWAGQGTYPEGEWRFALKVLLEMDPHERQCRTLLDQLDAQYRKLDHLEPLHQVGGVR